MPLVFPQDNQDGTAESAESLQKKPQDKAKAIEDEATEKRDAASKNPGEAVK
jgi:hypothetical protein